MNAAGIQEVKCLETKNHEMEGCINLPVIFVAVPVIYACAVFNIQDGGTTRSAETDRGKMSVGKRRRRCVSATPRRITMTV